MPQAPPRVLPSHEPRADDTDVKRRRGSRRTRPRADCPCPRSRPSAPSERRHRGACRRRRTAGRPFG
jgi:hypothetical protein